MNVLKYFYGITAASLLLGGLTSCEDEMNPTGGSLFNGEVQISVDSTTVNILSRNVPTTAIDARSTS
ncbi:MAG: hypothetical protein K2H35_02625, partial [Muribaculaceae bacterium]|nr:hypothetical protein [Muribaculaceae bacterium]